MYYDNKFNECGKNTKKLWNCINRITGKNFNKQPHRDLDCNSFNNYFSTIGEKVVSEMSSEPDDLCWKQPPCQTKFVFCPIEEEFVRKSLKKLGTETNNDVIGFDSKLLSLSSDYIAPILTKFFNASLITSIIPDDWKLARVIPVFKGKGEVSDMNNYRPISLISHISKIFEMSVHSQVLDYFQDNNLITIDQSAYRKLHNTQTALHRIIDDWIDNICFKTYTGICAFDIKKCFDTIDHRILLKKLQLYGVYNQELNWFKCYLSNRKQIVKCHGNVSKKRTLNVGVPQGSVIGPLLFIVFINDISQHVNIGTANLFADDTLIYCSGNSLSEMNTKLQNCVDDVSLWYKTNNIAINEQKCCSMIICPNRNECSKLEISVNDSNMSQVNTMNYLGLEIDERLTWNQHVNKLSKSLYFKVSKLAKLSKAVPKHVLIKIYNATIQPTIDYVITIWGCTNKNNVKKIQRLQNYCARIIEKNFDYVNSRGIELVKNLGLMNVSQRYFYFELLLIYKCIYGLAPPYLSNEVVLEIEIKQIRTRLHDMNLYLPIPESEYHKRMFMYRAARSWNKLPSNIKECTSLPSFKKLLKYYIKTRPMDLS